MFVSFSFFFWPLCCLSFFDLRILITPLVSSNSSCNRIGGVMVSVLASSPVDRGLLFQLATIINIKLSVYNADIIII
jgi:hypothetical protein